MYSAEIIVNGVKGYVGGSNATDLADGVEACAEAIENAVGKNTQNAYDDDDYVACDDGYYDAYDYYNNYGGTIDPYTHCPHMGIRDNY